jgi:hypothetical protein
MKATFFTKILLLCLFCLLLNSCTADDNVTSQNNPPVSAEGGPVIPPGPKP